MFFKISGSVGSGKTEAVLNHIKDNLDCSYLLVAPTIALCEELYHRIQVKLADHPEYVNNGPIRLIVSDENIAEGVYPRAMSACQDCDGSVPPIVIVTTKTFEYLIDNLDDWYKERFSVFVDEGLPSIAQVSFAPGEKEVFLRHLQIGEDKLASARVGHGDFLSWAAHFPSKLGSQQLEHLNLPQFRQIAALVLSRHYDAFVWETEKSIEVLGVLSPKPLEAFRSVTLIVAIFERTLLPILWKQRYGVEFEDFPLKTELFDAHSEKGPSITIWHVLHEADLPSKINLRRNFTTGETNEADERNQVISEAARQIDANFPDGAYCWAANTDFKNLDHSFSGTRMPAISAGLNEFRHFDAVVSLVCINPAPWVKRRVQELFELEDDHLYELWRFAYTYQTIGRCSLRLRESKRPISVVVASSMCAKQLAELFSGAEVKGQITNLQRYSGLSPSETAASTHGSAYTKADNSAYSKYRTRLERNGKEPLPKDSWFEQIRLPTKEVLG